MKYLFHPTQDNIVLNQLHFISSYSYYSFDVKKEINKALKKFGCKSAILSKIGMIKENCITKEKYEEMYKTNEESEKRMDLSIGEELETFIRRIKTGKINKDTIPKDGEYKGSFLLCLLDKEEREKLEQKDYDFMWTFNYNQYGEADVSEAEWKASESNMKFARSKCWRQTYFINAYNETSSSESSTENSSTYESSSKL